MNFLRNPGGGRIVVEGEPGVGKTTFVNYHRQLWESAADHRLLSPLTEISVREDWGERDFLLSLLSSLSARLRLDRGEKIFEKDPVLRKITAITGVHVEKGPGFSGKIRYVMNAITSLISHLPDSYAQPLELADAKAGLYEIVSGELRRTLRGMELEIFLEAVRQSRFTNSSLAVAMGKSKQQIQKYLPNWIEQILAAHAEKEGRNQFYEIDPRFLVLNESGK